MLPLGSAGPYPAGWELHGPVPVCLGSYCGPVSKHTQVMNTQNPMMHGDPMTHGGEPRRDTTSRFREHSWAPPQPKGHQQLA